jgi:hypothetical protein
LRLGRIELILLVLLVSGATFLVMQFVPSGKGGACTPLPLSNEVKTYIDSKMVSPAGTESSLAELSKMMSRVTAFETKLVEFEKFREMQAQLDEKRKTLSEALQDKRRDQNEVLAKVRNAELSRLRNDMATMCAGVSVKPGVMRNRIKKDSPPEKGSADDATKKD